MSDAGPEEQPIPSSISPAALLGFARVSSPAPCRDPTSVTPWFCSALAQWGLGLLDTPAPPILFILSQTPVLGPRTEGPVSNSSAVQHQPKARNPADTSPCSSAVGRDLGTGRSESGCSLPRCNISAGSATPGYMCFLSLASSWHVKGGPDSPNKVTESTAGPHARRADLGRGLGMGDNPSPPSCSRLGARPLPLAPSGG